MSFLRPQADLDKRRMAERAAPSEEVKSGRRRLAFPEKWKLVTSKYPSSRSSPTSIFSDNGPRSTSAKPDLEIRGETEVGLILLASGIDDTDTLRRRPLIGAAAHRPVTDELTGKIEHHW